MATEETPLQQDRENGGRDRCCMMGANIKKSLGDTKLVVHVLVAVFAIASWADLNGMWSELPQLTLQAPEQWTLPSYITLIGQIANVGPIAFVMVSYFASKSMKIHPKLEIGTSFTIIVLSMVAAFHIAFFYDKTSYVAGAERSTALLVLNFFLAVGDCTSSVCFYAFMSLLKPQYMASLLLGEGMSGLLPSVVALIQGAGDIVCVNGTHTTNMTFPNGTEVNVTTHSMYPMYEEPLFSVRVYFIIVSAMIACSAVAFVVLLQSSYCRSEFVSERGDNRVKRSDSSTYGAVEVGNGMPSTKDHQTGDADFVDIYNEAENSDGGSSRYNSINSKLNSNGSTHDLGHDGPYSGSDASADEDTKKKRDRSSSGSEPCGNNAYFPHPEAQISFSGDERRMSRVAKFVEKNFIPQLDNMSLPSFFTLMAILVVVNMTGTTFLPSIQTYTILPYGLEYYHLTTTLTQIANPVACFFALFVLVENVLVITMVTVLGEAIVAYIIYVAAMSPDPPMHDESYGGEVSVILWIALTLLLVYAKVCVAGALRKCGGRSALLWAGFVTQVGTCIGAVVGFLLVNHYKLFKDAPYC